MSGLLGIVNLDGERVDPGLLERMAKGLVFRAPDGLSVHCEGAAGLAHAMFRTHPEDRAESGIASLDGRVWVTAHARLDARADLLADLEPGCDHSLAGASDAELILQVYARRGAAGLSALIGDFSFAIWDAGRRELLAQRDAFGIKPFFYTLVERSLLFTNTLQCLLLHPEVSRDIDEESVADFLILGENPRLGTTFFRTIQRLPPAHRLTASRGSIKVERYWSLPAHDDVRYSRSSDYVEHFLEIFRNAVGDRATSRRATILMSGGLDSPSVAAKAKEVMAERGFGDGLLACTAVYDRLIPDEERYYAGEAASFLGIPIQFFPCDDYELFPGLGRNQAASTQPGIDTLDADNDIYRRAAAHSPVMLTAYGGDPAFQCSPYYLAALLRAGKAGRALREALRYLIDFRHLPWTGAGTFWRRRIRPGDPFAEYPGWLNPGFEARWDLRTRWREWNGTQREGDSPHPTRPTAHATLSASHWTNHFEALDPGASEILVDVRHPFFDLRLLRFLLGIPAIPWCVNKALLRRAMRGRIPESVRTRPKSPLPGFPVHPLPDARFRLLARQLRTTPELERFVRVEPLVQMLSAREAIDPVALDQALPALGVAEWLRTRTAKPNPGRVRWPCSPHPNTEWSLGHAEA